MSTYTDRDGQVLSTDNISVGRSTYLSVSNGMVTLTLTVTLISVT